MVDLKDIIKKIKTSDVEEHEDDPLPSYSKKGWIMVEMGEIIKQWHCYKREVVNVISYKSDSSVFWINEGTGIEYWLNDIDFPATGTYVIEGIHGRYIRGEWGFTDDDEEWMYDTVRLATEQEIKDGEVND